MAKSFDEIVEIAVQLSEAERERLAGVLLNYTEQTADELDEIDRLWQAEVARRIHALNAGRLKTIPAEKVHADLARRGAAHRSENVDTLHEGFLSYITSRECRIAYLYMIRFAEGLQDYFCFPRDSHPKREFRYYHDDKQPFAFIVNRTDLLFYFRRPSEGHPARDPHQLANIFGSDSVVAHDRGEVTVRICDVTQARSLMRLVFGMDGGLTPADSN